MTKEIHNLLATKIPLYPCHVVLHNLLWFLANGDIVI